MKSCRDGGIGRRAGLRNPRITARFFRKSLHHKGVIASAQNGQVALSASPCLSIYPCELHSSYTFGRQFLDDDPSWWDDGDWLMAIDLGYDESGSGDTLLVSVQLGVTEQAKKLKRKWRAKLRAADVEYFHANEFDNFSRCVISLASSISTCLSGLPRKSPRAFTSRRPPNYFVPGGAPLIRSQYKC
jgi:hypothetical protein